MIREQTKNDPGSVSVLSVNQFAIGTYPEQISTLFMT